MNEALLYLVAGLTQCHKIQHSSAKGQNTPLTMVKLHQ